MMPASPRPRTMIRAILLGVVSAASAAAAIGALLLSRLRSRAVAREVAGEFAAAVHDAADVVTATALTRVGHRAVVRMPGGAVTVLHDVPRRVGPGWRIAVSPDRRCLLAVPDRLLVRAGHAASSAGCGGVGCHGRGHRPRMPAGAA